jgi:hypothetical protein
MRTALLLTCLAGVAALPAQDNEFGAPVRTTIGAMRANPDAYQNVKVVFTAQFASLGRISNPFFTKFTPTDFTNIYAWGDDQRIWEEKSYNDVFGMLFLSKSNPNREQVYTMPLYTRMRCTGVVRNTFQSIPWVEVLEFTVLDERLDTAVLTHLHRGEKLMAQRLWQRAVGELSMVPGDDVPAAAVRAAHKNLGVCMLRMGESKAAVGYLKSAVALSDGNDAEAQQLLATAQRNPEEAIDRAVDSSSLSDSERPMWEAFEVASAATPARVLSR